MRPQLSHIALLIIYYCHNKTPTGVTHIKGACLGLSYGAPKSPEIFRFVSKKMPSNAMMPQNSVVRIVLVKDQLSLTSTMRMIKLCGITALFGIFLKANIQISQDLGTTLVICITGL